MNPPSDITVTLPGNLTAEDLAQCLAVIKEGDAVNIESATEELPLAKFVAVHRVDGTIVAVGAIKRQRGWYAGDVGKKSGVEVATDMHELGYVSVTENQKGKKLSKRITASLLEAFQGRPLFATTSSERMKSALADAKFEQRGEPWPGQKGELSLWLLKGVER